MSLPSPRFPLMLAWNIGTLRRICSKILGFQLSQHDLNLNRSTKNRVFFSKKKQCNLKDSPRFGVIISKSACQINSPMHESRRLPKKFQTSRTPSALIGSPNCPRDLPGRWLQDEVQAFAEKYIEKTWKNWRAVMSCGHTSIYLVRCCHCLCNEVT